MIIGNTTLKSEQWGEGNGGVLSTTVLCLCKHNVRTIYVEKLQIMKASHIESDVRCILDDLPFVHLLGLSCLVARVCLFTY